MTVEKLNVKKKGQQHFLTYWHTKYKYYQKYWACPVKDFRHFCVTARVQVTFKTGPDLICESVGIPPPADWILAETPEDRVAILSHNCGMSMSAEMRFSSCSSVRACWNVPCSQNSTVWLTPRYENQTVWLRGFKKDSDCTPAKGVERLESCVWASRHALFSDDLLSTTRRRLRLQVCRPRVPSSPRDFRAR